ncbi:MAG: hypothetical protein ABH832_00540 [bacterium]
MPFKLYMRLIISALLTATIVGCSIPSTENNQNQVKNSNSASSGKTQFTASEQASANSIVSTIPTALTAPAIARVYVNDGKAYIQYDDASKKIIATSTDKNEIKTIEQNHNQKTFDSAQLSPNKKFVALNAYGWEIKYTYVYEVEADQLHLVSMFINNMEYYPVDYVWTSDNKLKGKATEAVKAYGINLIEYTSKNPAKPWEIE